MSVDASFYIYTIKQTNIKMTTLELTPNEALKKAKQLISEGIYFDFFSKNSQYLFDGDFARINLWSEGYNTYKDERAFLNQLKRSSKDEPSVEINIYFS